ncbi:prolyl aminopeptidase [Marinicauda salina]|uniref:Proline iminopeptidase n=1 Tax=Marinicauda salina TaxID=2135793 RepID=A0A2U2BTW4_9PROT|nr:alpha/beta fold hydrolase [Marinicauda salina]PWE17427.1 prolyl aminopeptidase [Marinicauda salina]
MTSLFPEIEARETGRLSVTDGHELYWERAGAPGGRPLLFLHGGPGSGSAPKHRRYADPATWETIQFDQRGCGRSTPLFSLEANTTADLVADIEALRAHLGIERWTVFGPSWGSTLALAYAEAHPDRVEALIVEGVFLATPRELAWWHTRAGAGAVFPDALETLFGDAPEAMRTNPQRFIGWALDAMRTELAHGAPALEALADPDAPLDDLRRSLIYRWSEYEERLSWMEITPEQIRKSFAEKGRDWLIGHSLIEAHYFANACFLEPDQLMRDSSRLTMPVHIIQSRYDLVCPFAAAWRLARAVEQGRLHMVSNSGHAMTEPAHKAVREALKQL